MEKKLILAISACKECYGVDEVGSTMTVRDIVDFLNQYPDDTPVCISNDGGFTYGKIKETRIKEKFTGEENEEEF